MKPAKISFIIAILFLSIIFLLLPHTIELTGTLETWFPYKGLTLYKDIAMFHFPLGRFILFPLHLLSNWNLEFDPFVGLGIGITNLTCIYYFGKKYLSETAVSIALIFFAMFFWFFATSILYFHEMLIGLLLTISIFLLLEINSEMLLSAKKNFSLGFFLSLAEFSGQIATPTVFIGVLLALYIIIKKKTGVLKNSLIFTSGLALPYVILVLYFLGKNALWEFIYWNTIYYFTYASSTTPFIELPFKEISAFYLPLILLLILFSFKLAARKKVSFENAAIFFLALSSLPFAVHSIFHPHHLNYPLGILAITAGYAVNGLRILKNGKVIIIAASILFIFLGALTFIPWYVTHLSPPSLKIVNDVYPGDPMYMAVEWVKQNTNQNDKLMVLGDPLFYMRSDRLPASRPAKSIPYSWEPLEKVSIEIKATPPDYWIIDTHALNRLSEVNHKQNMVDFINSELKFGYSKTITFEYWEIWKRK